MVAADDDRRADLAGPDQLVEREAGPRPLAVAEPADPGGQALERDLAPSPSPASAGGPASSGKSSRIASSVRAMSAGSPRQRDPAERPAALAELGPDERRDEARVVEGVRDAGRLGLGPEVVAVVEDDRARLLEGEHRPDVVGHRRHRPADVLVGLGPAEDRGVVERDLRRHVADERVVGRGLVGDGVEPLAGARPRPGSISAALPIRAMDSRPAGGRGRAGPGERLGRIGGQPVDVADVQASPGAGLVDLDREADRVCLAIEVDEARARRRLDIGYVDRLTPIPPRRSPGRGTAAAAGQATRSRSSATPPRSSRPGPRPASGSTSSPTRRRPTTRWSATSRRRSRSTTRRSCAGPSPTSTSGARWPRWPTTSGRCSRSRTPARSSSTTATTSGPRRRRPASRTRSTTRASSRRSSGRSSARAGGRSAGSR